jgi:hypothetical protein
MCLADTVDKIKVCDDCGEPCTVGVYEDYIEYPDRDQNGMMGRHQLSYLSDCCRADYHLEEDKP